MRLPKLQVMTCPERGFEDGRFAQGKHVCAAFGQQAAMMSEEALAEREHARQGHAVDDGTGVSVGGGSSRKVKPSVRGSKVHPEDNESLDVWCDSCSDGPDHQCNDADVPCCKSAKQWYQR